MPFVPVDGCCRRCGRDAVGLDGEFLCEDCRTHRPAFDRAASAVRYDADARDMVNAFKFKAHFRIRDDLVDWLEGVVRARFRVDKIDLVVPMPSAVVRRWDRGYNQCALLARPLARRLGRPDGKFVLLRKGFPARQGGLGEDERRTNVIGTFAVARPNAVADRTVLVVDDIMTTGATLSDCARALKEAGAWRVWCLAVARSVRS